MHWSLVRLLSLAEHWFASAEDRTQFCARIVDVIDARLSPEHIQTEKTYVDRPTAAVWERPYGWAWLLRLYAEIAVSGYSAANAWRLALLPLADALSDRLFDYFERLPEPVRHGVHGNSAFAMLQALRFALIVGDDGFAALIQRRALDFFGDDRDYASAFDRSAEDFLSPVLTEALLMSLVLSRADFLAWFTRLLPSLEDGGANSTLLAPVAVAASHETDARLAHRHGLNLSRAWALRGLAQQFTPGDDPRWRAFGEAAGALVCQSLPVVTGGAYVSTHWLVSFYLLAETEWHA